MAIQDLSAVSPPTPQDRSPTPESISVLVIDDEICPDDALVRLLSLDGFRVTCAQTGMDGASRALASIWDVILLDLHLPDVLEPARLPHLAEGARANDGDRVRPHALARRSRARSKWLIVRSWIIPPVLAGLAIGVTRADTPRPTAIGSLLDLYDRGEYASVVRQFEEAESPRVLDGFDSDLTKHAKGWIEAADLSARRRRAFVAGAVALELTHALVGRESWLTIDRPNNHATHPEALPHVNRLIGDHASPPDAIEYNWTAAQLATWQEWNAPARMVVGDFWITPEPVWALVLGHPPLFQLSKLQLAFGRAGFLGEALARFPGDPRLLLARAEGRESIETRCAVYYCHDEISPAALEDLRGRTKAPPPDHPGPHFAEARRIHGMALANLAAFDRLLPIAAEFASLADAHPEVRTEANVHIGYLGIRAARPDAALTPLETARRSDDPYVRYLAEYFTGRALDALGRLREAIAAYRRALAAVPNAPSATILLAARLFVSNDAADREEAHSLLQAANAAASHVVDPWDLYWYGDARLWSTYMGRLRQALRQ